MRWGFHKKHFLRNHVHSWNSATMCCEISFWAPSNVKFDYIWCHIIMRKSNEEQIITGYPIEGAMASSAVIGGLFTKQRICCKRHPGCYIALWDTQTPPQRHLYCKFCWNLIKKSPTFPESMIKRTPSMVTEVSAILVETMHFLTPSGAISNTWERERGWESKLKLL